MPIQSLDEIRRQYKPSQVRWLFIGESPPANGTFFYKANSNLSRYTQQAFSAAFQKEFSNGEAFLDFFKSKGSYLIDMCNHPINGLSKLERNRQRKNGAASLPGRLAEFSPEAIIVVMKGIEKYVHPAIKQAGLDGIPLYVLPFPAMGNQHRYVRALSQVLRKLGFF